MTPKQTRAVAKYTQNDRRKSILHRIPGQTAVLLEYPAHAAAPLLKLFWVDSTKPATITRAGAKQMGFKLYSDLYKNP